MLCPTLLYFLPFGWKSPVLHMNTEKYKSAPSHLPGLSSIFKDRVKVGPDTLWELYTVYAVWFKTFLTLCTPRGAGRASRCTPRAT